MRCRSQPSNLSLWPPPAPPGAADLLTQVSHPPPAAKGAGIPPRACSSCLSVCPSQGVAFALLGALQQNGVGGAESSVCVLKPGAHPVHPTPGPPSLLTTQRPVLMGAKWGFGENPGPITVPSPTPSRSSVIDGQASVHAGPALQACLSLLCGQQCPQTPSGH